MRREYLIKRKIRNTYTFRLGQLGQLVHQIVDGNMTSDVPVEAAQRCCNRRRCNVARRINWKIVFWKAKKKLWFRTRRFSRNIFSWNAGCLSLKELFTLQSRLCKSRLHWSASGIADDDNVVLLMLRKRLRLLSENFYYFSTGLLFTTNLMIASPIAYGIWYSFPKLSSKYCLFMGSLPRQQCVEYTSLSLSLLWSSWVDSCRGWFSHNFAGHFNEPHANAISSILLSLSPVFQPN